ncbi:SubName: Full=Uncharacterized protein {ECO:0000313/EMBL:CCA71663.1} [Serendipita indica DSM 11827]|uniref:Uncharacterized protein n=1 Tax=Serendipita indica (strain DSM 11827) TaxID=1109443 RepID=G4TK13_SERID|nr:SubName: Full=Uncharacterized protein {ECO:0000313/EMBL:CCA71663.1} [Serendipita indica DSM 11827]CCA71663.1 hypothetical protein PIIN_05599 [Serendipita indica DSM 11827]
MVSIQPASSEGHAPQGEPLDLQPPQANLPAVQIGSPLQVAAPAQEEDEVIVNLVEDFIRRESSIMQGPLGAHLKRSLVQKVLKQRAVSQFVRIVPLAERTRVSHRIFNRSDALTFFSLTARYDRNWTISFLIQAFTLISTTAQAILRKDSIDRSIDSWKAKDTAFGAAAGALGGAASLLAGEALAFAGFTVTGVASGSMAALWQSAIGNVAANSLFATCQSLGATAALSGPLAWGACGGAVLGYVTYKAVTAPTSDQVLEKLLDDVYNDEKKREMFWNRINV